MKKGSWTPEEDKKLVDYIEKNNGYGSWHALPKLAGLNRCGKSCRLRWTNYLRPGIRRGNFSEDEEQTIINLHSFLGNKWSAIASHLPGRTDNDIKNLWNTHLKKKLLRRGIDPTTHKPRTDLHLFANFSQILAFAANLSSLMINPVDNVPMLQPDDAQFARIHLLHTIFQVLSHTNPRQGPSDLAVPPRTPSSTVPLNQIPQMFDYLMKVTSSEALGVPNPSPELCFPCGPCLEEAQAQQISDDSHNAMGSSSNGEILCRFNESRNDQMQLLMPASPERTLLCRAKGKMSIDVVSDAGNNPPCNAAAGMLDDWSELNDEGSSSYWKEILE